MECTTLSTLSTGSNELLTASFSSGPNLLSCPTCDRGEQRGGLSWFGMELLFKRAKGKDIGRAGDSEEIS
jgi:hypothetical protein